MQAIHISLKQQNDKCVELRYYRENPNLCQCRSLPIAQITDLIQMVKRDYYTRLPEELSITGQRLYDWLDGENRWLKREIQSCANGAVLAISTEGRLTHLPWEILHDGKDFLVSQRNPLVVPVRWLEGQASKLVLPANRPLRLLFMASDPDGEADLNFEREEGSILDATKKQPLLLKVEESGSLEGLKDISDSYGRDYFDVLHLTGHAILTPTGARFTVETETGDCYLASASELAQSLFSLPSLVFLSGCRTGQSGEIPSMAEELLCQGTEAVLGWGRPVLDLDGITAASVLYEALAAGYTLIEALARVYQSLIRAEARDWHALRLFMRSTIPFSLVTPLKTRHRERISTATMATRFLDHAGQVKVCNRQSFVGRRRLLQQSLQTLKYSDTIGVLLHGMGGLGKSSLAARLCDRLQDDFIPLVLVCSARRFDEVNLVQLLTEALREIDLRHYIQSQNDKLRYRLRDVLERCEASFLLVLDDFEFNLEPRQERFIPTAETASVLQDLIWAVQQTNRHRIIITCRYEFEFPELQFFEKFGMDGLRQADLRKKCDQLPAFQEDSALALDLRRRAIRLADGNPRLLEWLSKVLQSSIVDQEAILNQLEIDGLVELREKVLATTLLEQMGPPMREMLSRSLIFELPVPRDAIAAICGSVPDLNLQIQRAIELGLLEVSSDNSLRVPRILPLTTQSSSPHLYGEAAKTLHRFWRAGVRLKTEEQFLEMYRLAMLAGDEYIATEIGADLANLWNSKGQFGAVIEQGNRTLEITKDSNLRMITLLNTARAYNDIGQTQKAIQLYEQSKDIAVKTQNHSFLGAVIGNLGCCYLYSGETIQAINCFEQALKISESLKDQELQKFWHNNLGVSYGALGNLNKAIIHYEQALALAIQLYDQETEGTCYGNLSDCYGLKGERSRAIAYAYQAIAIQEDIRDLEGKLTAIHSLAEVLVDEGRYSEAIDYATEGINAAISSKVSTPKLMSEIYSIIACAHMYQGFGNLTEAWESANTAQRYDVPQNNHYVTLLLGLISARQNNLEVANGLFKSSIKQANKLLIAEQRNFRALDTKSLALCGIALSESNNQSTSILILESIKVYSRAREVARDSGIVHRVQRLFNYLSLLDTKDLLLPMQDLIGLP